MKGVQCYELFRGIALKNDTLFFKIIIICFFFAKYNIKKGKKRDF